MELMRVDVLGSAAFKPVKNDMVGNIKVRVDRWYVRGERAIGLIMYRKSATASSPPPRSRRRSKTSSSTSSRRRNTPPRRVCCG